MPFQIPFRMKLPMKFHTKSSLKWRYGGNFICNDLRSAISEITPYEISYEITYEISYEVDCKPFTKNNFGGGGGLMEL